MHTKTALLESYILYILSSNLKQYYESKVYFLGKGLCDYIWEGIQVSYAFVQIEQFNSSEFAEYVSWSSVSETVGKILNHDPVVGSR